MKTLWFFKRIKINNDYIICSDGAIYSSKRKCIQLHPYPGRQGYLRVQLYNEGKRVVRSVHSLKFMHFGRRTLRNDKSQVF